MGLPPAGPVRWIALAATVALVALLTALGHRVASRAWGEAGWAGIPLVLLAITPVFGPPLHAAAALAALLVATRNGLRFDGASRIASFLGAAGCGVAMGAAWWLFG